MGLLAGISVAILAGYLLNRRRRKYRAIAHPPENKTPAVVVVDTSEFLKAMQLNFLQRGNIFVQLLAGIR